MPKMPSQCSAKKMMASNHEVVRNVFVRPFVSGLLGLRTWYQFSALKLAHDLHVTFSKQ